jgi:membrane protein
MADRAGTPSSRSPATAESPSPYSHADLTGAPPKGRGRPAAASRLATVVKRTLVKFYDDQMTHHAAALTYYGLMSLFPAALLGLSLLGLLGQYPETYNAIVNYLRDVAPASVVDPLDRSLRAALQNKGTAATTLVISVVVALYGTTGVLEAARRALNVAFEVDHRRGFLRRKAVDVLSTVVLMTLVLACLVMVFVGGRFADDMFGFIGLGPTVADVWSKVRWPGALAVAMLAFAFIYYITPDITQRSFRWLTPGAVVGVLLWLLVSLGFSTYISRIADVGAYYGTFAAAIVLVGWLWLTNVALLFGAELNAEIEREKELAEGVRHEETLSRPDRGAQD